MAKLYSVRIDEVAPEAGSVETIGRKLPLETLEEVRDFLAAYALSWQQLGPPPVEVIEAQFAAQRAQIEQEDGPLPPGFRTCRFTLYPYGRPAQGTPVEHVITITEAEGEFKPEWRKGGLADG